MRRSFVGHKKIKGEINFFCIKGLLKIELEEYFLYERNLGGISTGSTLIFNFCILYLLRFEKS